MVERTRRRAAERKADEVQARIADMEALPYEDAIADVFVLLQRAAHGRRPARALQEVARCIRPGGDELLGTTFLREGGRRSACDLRARRQARSCCAATGPRT